MMQSRSESRAVDPGGATPRDGHEALVARARTLIADPEYPTATIVEELADLLILQHSAASQGK